ncbi:MULTISPECIES: tetratricopeptide repeat protein [unclassified Actinomyces]|uniref:tetratricopeptide repeat protein n=1 Tax=unclassified Actinomyces TaxID=2609248 RepID=UPI002016F341|nr:MULTISPECIES: tetratricopeptide repeat protein [unclassified Actinomyces]MCL3777793.1 tetratricopeptide repeat protein [Actinomyces sp. AC-20-1]MCL3790697.1 tetratricopeptide repeat protein [Actinomyces sp. 187325]MCL3792699.1 tetratricopeptide repeat protein [Actinomyces sp. 186855]MCL3795426.1 tetratricopeptide repeat protein [Actinomyces sp. 217892]
MSTPALPGEDTRFAPGGVSEDEQTAYAQVVAPQEAGEDPGARGRRLRRRRRLLGYGAVPAVLALAAATWMGWLSVMTMLGHSAVGSGDYATAVSRYGAVAGADPWLEQWRVHYNLGTAHLLAGDLDPAQTALEQALEEAPPADWVEVAHADGTSVRVRDPRAPECLVRTNLYALRTARWAEALAAGDAAVAEEERAAMTDAAGECEVDPPLEPSGEPSEDPSESPSEAPSPQPSGEPSPSPSGGAPSAEPSGEPGAEPSEEATPSPSPPVSEQQRELEERNGEANPTQSAGPGPDSRRRW